MAKPPSTIESRFWKKVLKTEGCWLWKANTNGKYGRIYVHGRGKIGAHVVSYELAYGPVPEGNEVCHHCDNKLCVRPDHLFSGTRLDNMRDAKAKGRLRGVKGSENVWSKLTENEVREIRERRKRGELWEDLADRFDIGETTARNICAGRKWRHIL